MKEDDIKMLAEATRQEELKVDAHLRTLKSRDAVLELEPFLRLRWFYLLQVRHAELTRVTKDLFELLEPNNETNIISVIGPTGIGKSTLGLALQNSLAERFFGTAKPHEVPVVYVKAPANGEKSMSWTTLYTRILHAGNEVLVSKKRAISTAGNFQHVVPRGSVVLGVLRESLEQMLKERNVRVLVIDEALHLLRFSSYSAVMDTLKSLADAHKTKLLLIGSYDIAELMTEYGQVARRSEIIHYRRYSPTKEGKEAFKTEIKKFQAHWPCHSVPNLTAVAEHLFGVSLGSIGILKAMLLRTLALQLADKKQVFDADMLAKGCKSTKLLDKIDKETKAGELSLNGACYGESPLADKDVFKDLVEKLMTKQEECVNA